jgi:catechol 2,3-dioxygenase-like lactoylglutathione lyase family enzyme
MRLKNFLIVVEDIERSKRFYRDLFGLEVVADFDGNVILTERIVLQERKVWNQLIGKESGSGCADAELYFEEHNLDRFLEKLEQYSEPIQYLNRLQELGCGQRVIRLYDPDGHVIEVKESLDYAARRYYQSGMPIEDVAKKTGMTLEHAKLICGVDFEEDEW